MRALAGRRAVIADGVFAAEFASTLRFAGAEVTTAGDAIPDLSAADIVVVCAPPATQLPGADAGLVADVTARALRWTEAAAAAMRAHKRGVIVHVTGLAGMGGWPGWHAPGAAFAAVHNIVRSHALELAPLGIRVNALVPGITTTLATTIADARRIPRETVRQRIPAGVYMQPENLTNALLYLVHDSASYVTGEILVVDGGWYTWGRLHAAAAS